MEKAKGRRKWFQTLGAGLAGSWFARSSFAKWLAPARQLSPNAKTIERMAFSNGILEPFVGVKIWYGDGSVVSIAVANLLTQWSLVPTTGVQAVGLFCSRFQPNDKDRRYVQLETSWDWYCFDPTKGGFLFTNNVLDIPPKAVAKAGQLLDKQAFLDIYNKAHRDYSFP